MRFLSHLLPLMLVLTTGVWMPVQAQTQTQTFGGSQAPHQRGDSRTDLTGLRNLAEQGDVRAQVKLSTMYALGSGVPRDDQQAVAWALKAARQGNATAQSLLGNMYLVGQGIPMDYQQAEEWNRKAAEQGNADGQFSLGRMYLSGRGVTKDEQQAANWIRKAAEQGLDLAQFQLGDLYQSGQGVPKDQQQAAVWYRKSAEQGYDYAQHALGLAYLSGRGLPVDEMQAAAWFRQAAEQGFTEAQSVLAAVYFLGKGVPKDYQSAYFWSLLASISGDPGMAKRRDTTEALLSPDQRDAAQSAARNWKPKTLAQSMGAPGSISSAGQGGSERTPNRKASAQDQADSTGSGFSIARGAIITNHHVIEGCSRLSVNGIAAQVRGSDARSDLALLAVTLAGPSVSLRTQRAAVGETVAVAGFPLRGLLSGFNMTTGSLSSMSGVGGDTRLLQITAPVQPGNSGGPMLDSSGNLMGVVVSKLDAIKAAKLTGDIPQNVNFAINANVLRSFLDANGADYNTISSDKPIAPTAIAERAKGFTVLVECWK